MADLLNQKSKAETFVYKQVKDLNYTLQIFGLHGACFFPNMLNVVLFTFF